MNPTMLIILVLFGGLIFWQSRQAKKQRENQEASIQALKKGDEVVTIGGLHAVVNRVDMANRLIELDAEGVILTFELSAIRVTNKKPVPTATENVENTSSETDGE